ncbi:hypothetical protein GGQ74_000949 [Desulfobaculum xiamenense]|uniref:Uncharacterized protein n=1 Tax=Desulfobaculum xiamenense TaxID=995050 RepID=A0A846QRL5_9BACT|nr:hypothetical protein [Desulfobaculum xiamenense]NJB67309.1 hypothetical protein [Desulfobaculum xiamenense]
MNYNEEASFLGVMMFVFFCAAFLATGFIARAVGADFSIVFTSLSYSCFVVIIEGIIYYLTRCSWHLNLSLVGSLLPVIIWPGWWPVLDSIAAGDSDKASFLGSIVQHKEANDLFTDFGPHIEWYNDSMFKWSIEIALVALVVLAVWKKRRY